MWGRRAGTATTVARVGSGGEGGASGLINGSRLRNGSGRRQQSRQSNIAGLREQPRRRARPQYYVIDSDEDEGGDMEGSDSAVHQSQSESRAERANRRHQQRIISGGWYSEEELELVKAFPTLGLAALP